MWTQNSNTREELSKSLTVIHTYLHTHTHTQCNLKYNSYTNYLDLLQTSQVKGIASWKNYPYFRYRSHVWGFPASHTSGQLAANPGIPMPPSRFDNLQEWLTELRKALNVQLQFYYKECKSGTAKCRHTWVRSERAASAELLCPQDMSPSLVICTTNQKGHLGLGQPELLLEFYYLGMTAWIIGHVTEVTLQRHPFHQR